MITSSRQYREAQEEIVRLRIKLDSPPVPGVPSAIFEADEKQTLERMEYWQELIDDYDRITATPPTKLVVSKPSDLLLFPIWYRLSSKLNLDDFAKIVGTSKDQVMRWEKAEYRGIKSDKLAWILETLHLHISGVCHNTVITR